MGEGRKGDPETIFPPPPAMAVLISISLGGLSSSVRKRMDGG